jgi:YVTN family beta-propeller protein
MLEHTVRPKFSLFVLLLTVFVSQSPLAQTPSPALLVLNKNENSLAIVNPQSAKVIARIPTGEGPHEVTASDDGKFAFVANYGSGEPGSTISVIDLVRQQELRRVNLGPLRRPHGIVFANGQVYFTAEINKVIGRYSPTDDRVDWLLGTGQDDTHLLVLSKDGDEIFTSNIGSNSVNAIRRASNQLDWLETVIPVGDGPEGIDISPDGAEVWTAQSRDGNVSIIGVATRKVVQTLRLNTKRSNRLKFSPDGRLVLISDLDGGDLIVLDAHSRTEIKRLRLGHMPEGILITPDGSKAYVAVAGDGEIAVVDLSNITVVGHIATGSGPDGMAWAGRK